MTITNAIGVSTVKFTVDVDTSVVGFVSNGDAVLSRDPNVTVAGFISPSAIGSSAAPIAVALGATKSPISGVIPAVGVLSGEEIYCAFSAAASAIIYFDT